MAEARRRAAELTGATWILARHQTAATGRRGRAWQNPAGNFSATLFLRPTATAPADAALRSFTAAVALYQTLAMLVPPATLALKWPNDVLLNGGKVAGILLESAGRAGRVDWLSIGIGVNLGAAPAQERLEPDAMAPVALADVTGRSIDPETFLVWLAVHFDSLERTFGAQGFEPIRRLWLRHAAKLGEVITAKLGADRITGTFDSVDAGGNLVVITPKGRETIAAADVYF